MYAYWMFHDFKMLPSSFAALDIEEKAMIMAFIDEKLANEKKQREKMKRSQPKGKSNPRRR